MTKPFGRGLGIEALEVSEDSVVAGSEHGWPSFTPHPKSEPLIKKHSRVWDWGHPACSLA